MLPVAIVMIAVLVSQVEAPDDPPRAEEYLELARAEAQAYKIMIDGAELTLEQDPVLRWTNPVAGEIYGGAFVWSRDGRPEVVASIFKWYRPYTHMTHEFQAITDQALSAEKDGKQLWESQEPGVKWLGLDNAPAPASSAAGRLIQMRSLAKQFSVELTEKDGVRRSLRLLSQPVHRYKSEAASIFDGTIFVFANATDPDALLLLEGVGSSTASKWRYTFARLNFVALKAKHGNKTVWDVPELNSADIYSHRKPYTKFHIGEVKRTN